MATKLCLVFLIFAVVIAVESTTIDDATWGMTRLSSADGGLPGTGSCNGRVGECIGEEEALMDSESGRRQLAGKRKVISYAALKRDKIPCNRAGQSYYYCRSNVRVNPYRRGCTYITHCARDLTS